MPNFDVLIKQTTTTINNELIHGELTEAEF